MTMKEELAALKKKRDAGKITAFQFKKQSNKIKEKYGKKGKPSNVSKIFTYISTKSPADAVRDFAPKLLEISPRSAKAVADKKAAGLANRGKSQGGRTAAEVKKYEVAKKVAKSAAASAKAKNKDTFKGLDLNKGDKKSSGKTLSKFEQAFANARKAGKKTFKFTNRAGNTNTYTTERKDKKPLPKKGKK